MDEARYREAEQTLWASIGAGLRLRVQEIGDGPPILFIHGANTSGASWATLAAKLPAFRCLLLDRPGTGLSEAFPVRPTTAQLMALGDGLVADILDGAGIASAQVVATSLGGFLALRSAAAHPDRIIRMVQREDSNRPYFTVSRS